MVFQQQSESGPVSRPMRPRPVRKRFQHRANDPSAGDPSPSWEIMIARELDRSDMARLASGDEEAMHPLMRRHSKRLRRYLMKIVKHSADATELVQETFVRISRHRADFDQQTSFSTWLYTIAFHLAIDLLRWRSRHAAHVSLSSIDNGQADGTAKELIDSSPTPSEQLEAKECANALEGALANLPEKLRLPLRLAALEDSFQAEIAAQLGCSSKAVEMRIYHARQRLRAELQRSGGPVPFAFEKLCPKPKTRD